jgi:phosphomethylpyrimidine synthase
LEKRGVLAPEEIHRLASKTKKVVAGSGQKASCHSDVASSDEAKAIQETLVESTTK